MPLRHTISSISIDSLAASTNDAPPSGPLSGPSHTRWRRQRLLRIGSSNNNAASTVQVDADETSSLHTNNLAASYGTLPSRQHSPLARTNFRSRHNLPALPGLSLPRGPSTAPSQADSPVSPTSFRGISTSYFNTQRPISAYDALLIPSPESEEDLHARTNGIRVWYSSFSSIDWLHDAIKDSVRFSRLRRGKSLRSKIRLLVDKSMGWIIVTLVGFFTAIVAFLVVRAEQWFFDSKEGYCRTDWMKAKRFCCPMKDMISGRSTRPSFVSAMGEEPCTSWRTWAEVFGPVVQRGPMIGYEAELVQYVAYTIIAASPKLSRRVSLDLTNHPVFSSFWRWYHVF